MIGRMENQSKQPDSKVNDAYNNAGSRCSWSLRKCCREACRNKCLNLLSQPGLASA